jgi:U4/U6.U5 tri-snRNP-associated protein 2
LKKFDGSTYKDTMDGRRTFKITKFPKYILVYAYIIRFLILHMKRFLMNNFFMEKNSTIVSFPINGLDLT